ncbi:hypothetical protein P7C70_g7656, partial [Phenoliferia sp. Uapishka_3]
PTAPTPISKQPLFRPPSPESSDDDDQPLPLPTRAPDSDSGSDSDDELAAQLTGKLSLSDSKRKGKGKEQASSPTTRVPPFDAGLPIAPPMVKPPTSVAPASVAISTPIVTKRGDLHLYDLATGLFMLQEKDVQVGLHRTPKGFWLVVEGKSSVWVSQGLDLELPINCSAQALSVVFNFRPDVEEGEDEFAMTFTWLVKFEDEESFGAVQQGVSEATYELKWGMGSWKKLKEDDKEYQRTAYIEDSEMYGMNEKAPDEVGDEIYEEEEEDEESGDEENDPEDEREFAPKAYKSKNTQLAVGYKDGFSFVVQGDMIGVFKQQQDGGRKVSLYCLFCFKVERAYSSPIPQLDFVTSIVGVSGLDSKKTFTPQQMMLMEQDTQMVLQNPNDPHSLYKMDLTVGKVVEEYEVSPNFAVKSFIPDSKFAQMEQGKTFIGTSTNGIFRIDPRLAGSKLVDSEFKQYATKADFSVAATTESGRLAVASNKGDIRLFDKIGKNAKTVLPALGDAIIGLDVSADGKWILATCKTYLLLVDTVIPDGAGRYGGSSGFDRSFPADQKPQAKRLNLKPEHVALMEKESKAGVSFTKAKWVLFYHQHSQIIDPGLIRFNTAPGSLERTIVVSTGPFIVAWNFRQVKAGETGSYIMRRIGLDVDVNSDLSPFSDQIVTTPGNVFVEDKKKLKDLALCASLESEDGDVIPRERDAQDQIRVAELEGQLATLVAQLEAKNAETATVHTIPSPLSSPRTIPDLTAAILFTFDQQGSLDERLRKYLQRVSMCGEGRRGGNVVAEETQLGRRLIIKLLESFRTSSLARLPAFHHLASVLAPYDFSNQNLAIDTMECSAQDIFGTPPSFSPDDASIGDLVSVGARREQICRRLGDLCWDLAGRLGFFWEESSVSEKHSSQRADSELRKISVVLAWVEWQNLDSIKPDRALCLLKIAVEAFRQVQARSFEPDVKVSQRRDSLEAIVLTLDAAISSKLLSGSIAQSPTSPDFAQALSTRHLSETLDSLSRVGSGSKDDIEHTLMVVTQHIVLGQGRFARLCLAQHGLPRSLAVSSVHNLWNFVDSIHGSVQRLQHLLAMTGNTPEGGNGDERSLDVFILLAVRLDLQLIDLCTAMHTFLGRHPLFGVPDLRAESLRRIRKCLKLVAFYSQVRSFDFVSQDARRYSGTADATNFFQFFLSSRDTYFAYHLFSQLEVLPQWTLLASQRLGDTPGPMSQEFEVSVQELDWFETALRTACLYSLLPAQRLRELVAFREQSPRMAERSTFDTVASEDQISDPSDDSPSLSLSSGETTSPGEFASPNMYQPDGLQSFAFVGGFEDGQRSGKASPYNPGVVSQDWAGYATEGWPQGWNPDGENGSNELSSLQYSYE